MTADEWFEIEDNGIGESGRWRMSLNWVQKEGNFIETPRIILTSLNRIWSIFDEDLYDGYKIKEKKNAGKEN